MSFTQKKRRNVGVCNGCERRCVLGVHQEQFDDNELKWRTYPVIAGDVIESYVDHRGLEQSTEIVFGVNGFLRTPTGNAFWIDVIQATQIQKAYEITKLCDHYKTR